jgi:hypothetical protein
MYVPLSAAGEDGSMTSVVCSEEPWLEGLMGVRGGVEVDVSGPLCTEDRSE